MTAPSTPSPRELATAGCPLPHVLAASLAEIERKRAQS